MDMPGEPTWTEERVDRLLSLAREGQAASAIADKLGGGITRNAVIGKLHRLEARRLLKEGNDFAGGTPPAAPPAPAKPLPSKPPTRPLPIARPPSSALPLPAERPETAALPVPAKRDPALIEGPDGGVGLNALGALAGSCRHCRFITAATGDPATTRYCGARTTAPGKSWCGVHAAICTPAPASRAAA